ncbi:MAG: hypothetical protein AAGA58_13225 [Verrucomicrobiota bacterium]
MTGWGTDSVEAVEQWIRERVPVNAPEKEKQAVREEVHAYMSAVFRARENPPGVGEVEEWLARFEQEQIDGSARRVASLVLRKSQKAKLSVWEKIRRKNFMRASWIVWFVFLPALTFGVEAVTHWCGSTFFDPLPTIAHGLLVAVAVAGCVLLWLHSRETSGDGPLKTWAGLFRGYCLVIGSYYGLLVAPILIVTTIYYIVGVVGTLGMALVVFPLFFAGFFLTAGPLFVALGALMMKPLQKERRIGPTFVGGAIVGIVSLLAIEGPNLATRVGIANNDPELIRNFGSRETLLRACYEGSGFRAGTTDTVGWLASGFNGVEMFSVASTSQDANRARELYYRVTGNSFNSVQPPSVGPVMLRDGRSENWAADFDFDPDVGGDVVAGRVRGLTLASSRLDGHVDETSRLGYWEWTAEFANAALREAREARMQLLLPHAGVVSRLTLWVEGEPQEAAFGPTAKVASAYKSVAVVQQRDPVLVRWEAPDRILVQCFPVPAQGTLKFRVGITAPIPEDGVLAMPRIIERNFGLGDELRNDVWVESATETELFSRRAGEQARGWKASNGSLPANLITDGGFVHAEFAEKENVPTVWTKDIYGESGNRGGVLVRKKAGQEMRPLDQLIVVVDGSARMAPWKKEIAEAVREAGNECEVKAFFAYDGVRELSSVEQLQSVKYAGGHDGQDALRQALASAKKKKEGTRSAIVWLHGPQPYEFKSVAGLNQEFTYGNSESSVYTVPLAPGKNRIIEKFGRRFSSLPAPLQTGDLTESLQRLCKGEVEDHENWDWQELPAGEQPEGGREVGDQLARFGEWQRLEGLKQSRGDVELGNRAAFAQLVTPWSGAVVLERARDYEAFDLEQVKTSTVPSIPIVPEPSTAMFTLLSFSWLILRRKRMGE